MLSLSKSVPVIAGSVQKACLTALTQRSLTSASQERWDLFSAVCIERTPLVAPKLNVLEESVKKALEQYEYARSLKSDHEIRLIRDE
jgi:hypothetical protein